MQSSLNGQTAAFTNDAVFIDGKTPYYQSRLLNEYGIRHAFFTRIGGVSEGVFESLNFAEGIGEIRDSEERVLVNYDIAAKCFGLSAKDVCRTYQTHTSVVVLADESKRGVGIVKPKFDFGVDGLVTTERDLLLSVRTADCVPVLLCDKSKSVCAAVHAGWRGTVGGITKNAVEMMCESGVDKSEILVAIGPCIGKCCYEVGEEVRDEFLAVDPLYGSFFTPNGQKFMLDLNKANEEILVGTGIPRQNISRLDLCTKCNENHFFSHRRNGTSRGTMSAFICL